MKIIRTAVTSGLCMQFVTDLELYPMFVGTSPFHMHHCQQGAHVDIRVNGFRTTGQVGLF